MAADALHLGLQPRSVAAGQVITGVVTLRLSKPRLLADLQVELLGEASVYWTEYGCFYGNMSRYREYARSWSTAVSAAQPRVTILGAGKEAPRRTAAITTVTQPAIPATTVHAAKPTLAPMVTSKVVTNVPSKVMSTGPDKLVSITHNKVLPIGSKNVVAAGSSHDASLSPGKIASNGISNTAQTGTVSVERVSLSKVKPSGPSNIISSDSRKVVSTHSSKTELTQPIKVAAVGISKVKPDLYSNVMNGGVAIRVEANAQDSSRPGGGALLVDNLLRPGMGVSGNSTSPLPGAADRENEEPMRHGATVTVTTLQSSDTETSENGSSAPTTTTSLPKEFSKGRPAKTNGKTGAQNGTVTSKKGTKSDSRQEDRGTIREETRAEMEANVTEENFAARGILPLHFSGNETFLKQLITLLPPPASTAAAQVAIEAACTLGAGRHAFPFRVPLPRGLPPSFEGRHGHVRYSARARLHAPALPPLEAVATFLVTQPPAVANAAKGTQGPVSARGAKRPWPALCLGPVAATLELSSAEVRAGDRVRCTVHVENRSRKDVTAVVCALKKVTDFQAQLPYREELRDEVTLARQALGPVASKSSGRWMPELSVPDAPPGFRAGRVLRLHYVLQVDVTSAAMSSNLCVQLPVTLLRSEDSV